jgi:glycerol-3-phosphate cytidylyltransferase
MVVDSLEKLIEIVEKEKSQGKRVLIKKGDFDILHPGHIFAIQEFQKIADIVIILIQCDAVTTANKGPTRPINSQQQRASVIDSIKGVDYVFLDSSKSREEYLSLLKKIKPTILAVTKKDKKKTQDYSTELWELKEFEDKNLPGFSTSEIIKKVLEKQESSES